MLRATNETKGRWLQEAAESSQSHHNFTGEGEMGISKRTAGKSNSAFLFHWLVYELQALGQNNRYYCLLGLVSGEIHSPDGAAQSFL